MQDNVLQSVVTGVYVITAQHQGRANGSTVAWVTPVSFDPPLVMVSLSELRVSHGLIKSSGYFGLNCLAEGQIDVAKHFGFKTARDVDKLEGISYSTSSQGLPILDDAWAFIECRVVESYPAGDHTLFLGEVISANVMKEGQKPLLFNQEDYF